MIKEKQPDIEQQIGVTLRIGILTSITLMVVGFLLYISSSPHQGISTTFTHIKPSTFIASLTHLNAKSWMLFGLFCLILTPVLRVIASIYAFTKVKDWSYVTITCVVLAILILAIIIGQP